jgi:hypothetical protein
MSLKAASSFLAAPVDLCQHVHPFPKAAVPAPHSPPFYTFSVGVTDDGDGGGITHRRQGIPPVILPKLLTVHSGQAACFGSGETIPASVGRFNQCPDLTIPTLTSLALGQSVTVAVQFANLSGVTNFTAEV